MLDEFYRVVESRSVYVRRELSGHIFAAPEVPAAVEGLRHTIGVCDSEIFHICLGVNSYADIPSCLHVIEESFCHVRHVIPLSSGNIPFSSKSLAQKPQKARSGPNPVFPPSAGAT